MVRRRTVKGSRSRTHTKFIKRHAVVLSRIAVTIAALGFCAVFLINQPAFVPENPISEGKTLVAEKMSASLETDDLDLSTVSNKTSSVEKTGTTDKTDTGKAKEADAKEGKNDSEKNNESKEKKGTADSDDNKKGNQGKKDNGNSKNDSNKPAKPSEDPNSNNPNDTGITDSDDPTNQEGEGNTGQESILPGSSDTDKPVIVTDLNNYLNPRVASFSEIPEGKLKFYAYIDHKEENMSLRARLKNTNTSNSGKYLTATGRDYLADLAKGKNTITLYILKDGTVTYHITYTIQYVPDKATPDRPSVGEHPPVITAYGTSGVNDFTASIKIPNYVFRVRAEDHKGNYLPYDNIQIEFSPEVGRKQLLKHPTGSGMYEYDVYFQPPVSGESYHAKVNITAWDNEGNSSFRSYTLTYEEVGEDQVIGRCGVYIDMTTIGFGIEYAGYEYEVHRGDRASDCVMAALDYYGLRPEYSGTIEDSFYLRGLTAGFLTRGARIPEMLKDLLILDGLTPNNGHSNDRLYEFDFTRGSGWMYTIDGVNYPGRGMDKYILTGNETITLRFTLAYGKDLGLSSNAGGTLLSRYCGSWYNGSYHPNHQYEKGGGDMIPGENCENGARIKCWHCRICGKYFMSDDFSSVPVGYENQVVDGPYITLPPGEHQWKEVGRTEPTTLSEGRIDYECAACGAKKYEVIPKLEDNTGGNSGAETDDEGPGVSDGESEGDEQ